MLRVRVVSPPQLTDRLLQALAADAGIRNLVVLTGAAQRPAGDAVGFDVLTGSANPVLRQLRDLRLDRQGSILIDPVAATLTGPASPTEARTAGHRETAPVWELVDAGISRSAAGARRGARRCSCC